MSLKKALNVGPSGIEVAYECFGEAEAVPVLLIMGVGAQMLSWHEGFCAELAARGLRPIRFDNRDVGLSSHFSDAPVPDFKAALSGDTSSAFYNLSDMAADTVGLLDALGLKSAHLVGASMGGYIAQTVAIEYPDRVRSLTSMMSTTGNFSFVARQVAFFDRAMNIEETISIVPYDFQWPSLFEKERDVLCSILRDKIIDFQHIGSTAIVGLWAKPIIDIIGGVINYPADSGWGE